MFALAMQYGALVSSISFAEPGAKALHTAATPQEVTFLAPRAPHVQFESHVRPFPPLPSSVLALWRTCAVSAATHH